MLFPSIVPYREVYVDTDIQNLCPSTLLQVTLLRLERNVATRQGAVAFVDPVSSALKVAAFLHFSHQHFLSCPFVLPQSIDAAKVHCTKNFHSVRQCQSRKPNSHLHSMKLIIDCSPCLREQFVTLPPAS